jgi:hypothetical protein
MKTKNKKNTEIAKEPAKKYMDKIKKTFYIIFDNPSKKIYII